MPSGRPPLGISLVEKLEGSEESKQRLRVILSTLAGELTIAEACSQLGIGESRFHEMRTQALEAALQGIAPRKPGRRSREISPEEKRAQEAEQKASDLEYELYTRQVRDELMASLPHVLIRPEAPNQPAQKKPLLPHSLS